MIHTMTPVAIRLATKQDLVAINEIYNHYVLHSTCTYQEEPEPIESRQEWFRVRGPKHPVTVAHMDGQVVGWGALSDYKSRCAYRHTVENSVYVDPEHHRRGIGSSLLEDLIARAHLLGYHAIIAVIDGEQVGSEILHAKAGFLKVGHFKEVGFKFGRWLDVIYMERILAYASCAEA